MPQQVEIDGVEKTVYSEEEVTPLKTANEEAVKLKESVTKLNKELGVEEGQPIESIFEKVKEMKESANPNWKEARQVMKGLKDALKEKGVEVDDSGKIKSNPQGVSAEDVQKMIDDGIAKGISSATLKLNKNESLAGYSAEDRAKLEPVLDKLMTLGGSVEENLSLAESKVFPERAINSHRRVYNSAAGGGATIQGENKNDFSESAEGKSLGEAMGLSSFKKKAK